MVVETRVASFVPSLTFGAAAKLPISAVTTVKVTAFVVEIVSNPALLSFKPQDVVNDSPAKLV